jgi:hypothetical protein
VDIYEHKADSERLKRVRAREAGDSFRTVGRNGCPPMFYPEEIEILISEIETKLQTNELILISHVRQIVSFFF